MSPKEKRLDFAKSATVVAAALFASLAPAIAFAQETAAPAPAPKLAAVATTTTQDPAAPSNVVTQTEPPAPAAEDASSKPLSTAVWGRIGNYIQGTGSHEARRRLAGRRGGRSAQRSDPPVRRLAGRLRRLLRRRPDRQRPQILDLIGKLELHKTFNLWVGRMLVPSDRSNFSGPWFMAPWNYPGFYPGLGAPAGPRQGAFGRNDGATVWGDFGGGTFKYYLGAFDLRQREREPALHRAAST